MGAGTFFSALLEKGKDLFSRLAEQAAARRRLVLIAAAGFLVIILLLLILAGVTFRKVRNAGTARNTEASAGLPEGPAFLPEDFFLPYEPDFVPDVLLEREPRNGWTEEDARPFWTDPLNGNEEVWRERIESGVDAILEHVP
ncbi:MAG: hypothetical protein LBK74_01035 [Treponema sp.]|jgi:hypothetical protein|nr:hypothetical protein [Treponema sp.]